MIGQATQYASNKMTDATQRVSDGATRATEVASQKFDEATQKASETAVHVAEEVAEISPFHQMIQSVAEDFDEEEELIDEPKDRSQNEFFDKLEEEQKRAEAEKNEEWIPNRMRRYFG